MKTKTKSVTMKRVERRVSEFASRRDIAVPPRALPQMKGPIVRRFWAHPNDLNAGDKVRCDHRRTSKGRERVAVVRIRNPALIIARGASALRGSKLDTDTALKVARGVLEGVGVLWRPRTSKRRAA